MKERTKEDNEKIYILKPEEVTQFFLTKEKEGMKLHERDRDNSDEFFDIGTQSLETAIDRANLGCEKCATKIKTEVYNVIKKQNSWGTIYKLPSDVVGPFVDPGLLSMGVPEACVYPFAEKQHVIGDDGIDLILNGSVSWMVHADVIRARGILACTLALMCERLEIATRIILSYVGDSVGVRNDFVVILKDYSRPLDIPLLAFYLISPASFRRIGFSLFDSVDSKSKYNSHRYPSNTRYKTNRKRKILIDHGMIRDTMLDGEKAVAEAITLLKQNGVIA